MSSIDEVVKLIENLYSPNPTVDVNQTQLTLQSLQKSNDGSRLAVELLSVSSNFSPNVKYFGALTLTVQLNTAQENSANWNLLKYNLNYLIQYSALYASNPSHHGSLFITIKKLMSNLSLIFMNINDSENDNEPENLLTSWSNPLDTFVTLLSAYNGSPEQINDDQLVQQAIQHVVPYNDLINFISTSPSFNELLLILAEIIVEDLTKYQSMRHSMSKIHELVHSKLYVTAMALLNFNLINHITNNKMTDVIFNAVSAWINYVSMTRATNNRMDLSELFQNLLNVMLNSNEEVDGFINGEKVISVLGNVFSNDPTLMNFDLRSQVEVIFLGVSRTSDQSDATKNGWMLQYMNHLVTNEMTSALKDLAICIVDFLQVNTLDLCNKLFTNISTVHISITQQYIKVLLQLTNFPLIPVIQEFFSVKMADFWADLADSFINLAPETLSPNASQIAIDIFQQAVNIYLPKVSLLNKQKILDENDISMVHEFDDFRNAVVDLSQSLWNILGNEHLANVLMDGIGNNDVSGTNDLNVFYQIESMGFLLNALLTDMSLGQSPWLVGRLNKNRFFVKNIILQFNTGVFNFHTYLNCDAHPNYNLIKLDFIRTSTNLMATLADYFKSDPTDLSFCIEALFQGLESCTSQNNPNPVQKEYNDKMEVLIIKTITTVCEKCREQLTQYLMHFVGVLNTLTRPDSNVSTFTRGKLTRSIGYIVECMVSQGPEEQAKYIVEILNSIENFINQCLSLSQQNKEQKEYIHNLLSCISELGSSLIHPDEIQNEGLIQRLPEFHNYWLNDPLQCRPKLLSLLDRVLTHPAYGKDSSFIEVSCLILGKTLGLPDDEPHFLKYSMQDIMNFILRHIQSCELTTSLPFFVYLLEKLLIQFKTQLSSGEIDFLFDKIFLQFYSQYIQNDPDLLQTMINFSITVLETSPSLIINSSHWTSFILPTFLRLLPSHEKFTVVAVTKFWSKVINNKKYSQQDLELTRSQILSRGQELTYHTMYGLFHTQRSDINSYTELIRSLVAKFPMETKNWLIITLPQLCDNALAHEKFISKLFVTRGSRAAGNVILNWWLECSSLPSYNN
ncbi:hypothetical protein KAFR_0F03230 [Kazachstania africana CBS 2517]|uniref:Importin N-terminal domain-containing protein n=1 Tax=Kazachstania africana (strain ATCC 22294 / BCRC 22015 / CBS 2517 / CECT 1963 / NBRC 1671 / NRRL Y-8276) TaxID=1071382 RepID=H2AX19_KAZAF|nr:hypothetical protein KAFR_0F03230 [Kazachstania africana CBS 2517]CCF58919.1 hypothetical protein KAFR_0F03230 [Kazachstania africana CBS 2517]